MNYVRWHFECDLCDTAQNVKEEFSGDPRTTLAVPRLPYGWNRIGDYLACPKHKISLENGGMSVHA